MFNSMVLELRRRVSSGLSFQTSYVFGHATQSQFLSLRIDSPMIRNVGAEGDVTHAFKANVVYRAAVRTAASASAATRVR